MELGDSEAFTVAFARGRRAFQPRHVEANRRATAPPTSVTSSLESRSIWREKNLRHRDASTVRDHRPARASGVRRRRVETRRCAWAVSPRPSDRDDRCGCDAAGVKAGEEVEIAIDYAGQPRRGLYFVGPMSDIRTAGAGVDAGRGRGFALLVPMLRLPEQPAHRRGSRDGAGAFITVSNGALDRDRLERRGEDHTFNGGMTCRVGVSDDAGGR